MLKPEVTEGKFHTLPCCPSAKLQFAFLLFCNPVGSDPAALKDDVSEHVQ